MPNPREAVYDVLLAQKQRARDEQRAAGERGTLAEQLEAWTEANRRSGAAVRR
jgi:hypothetical protein